MLIGDLLAEAAPGAQLQSAELSSHVPDPYFRPAIALAVVFDAGLVADTHELGDLARQLAVGCPRERHESHLVVGPKDELDMP